GIATLQAVFPQGAWRPVYTARAAAYSTPARPAAKIHSRPWGRSVLVSQVEGTTAGVSAPLTPGRGAGRESRGTGRGPGQFPLASATSRALYFSPGFLPSSLAGGASGAALG